MVVDSITFGVDFQESVTGPQLRVDTGVPYEMYFTGLVGMTHGSVNVLGYNTKWTESLAALPAGVSPRFFSVRGDQEVLYEIAELKAPLEDGTELLTLKEPYCGPTSRASSYTIFFYSASSETKEVYGGTSVVLDISALPFEQMCLINHNVALLDKAIAWKLGV